MPQVLGNKEVATRQYVLVRRGAANDVDNADEVFLTRPLPDPS